MVKRFGSNSCYQIIASFLFFFFREGNKKEIARGSLPANRTPTAPWTITRVKSKPHRPIEFTVATYHCRQLRRCPEIVLPGLEDLGEVFWAWRACFRICLELASKWPTGLTTSGNKLCMFKAHANSYLLLLETPLVGWSCGVHACGCGGGSDGVVAQISCGRA